MLTSAVFGRFPFQKPLSEPLHQPLVGVSPAAQVLSGFCCRIRAAPGIFYADDAIVWVSIELCVHKSLVRPFDAGVVPGVLRFLQRTSARDDPGAQRSPADGRLAAHVQLPTAHVATPVDLLHGEQSWVAVGFLWTFR